MLEGLLHHKKETKEYLVALVVTESRIDAALWETTSDGKVNVLKTAKANYSGDWEAAINAADQAISNVEDVLPEGEELKKVVFGLFPEWIAEDRIKEPYLKRLKQLTTALSLTPLGFVELSLAIMRLLQRDEGTQPTVILVGIETKHLNVALFKISKMVGSITLVRTDNEASDLEKALTSFPEVEVLPSRILLYGTEDLDKIRTELLNYPWQKKADFLHFPKIELLPDDFAVKAVAISSSSEITTQLHKEEPDLATSPIGSPTEPMTEKAHESKDMADIAKDLGFVSDEPVTDIQTAKLSIEQEVPIEPELKTDTPGFTKPSWKGKWPFRLSLPKLNISVPIPRLPKFGLLIVILAVLFLLAGSIVTAVWFLPKAKVTLLVRPQRLEQTEQISVDTKAESVDVAKKLLPAKTVSVELTGSTDMVVTGKDTVGEKAKGEVIIYNKTLNNKNFKKGTLIKSGNLKFSFDNDITVEAAKEGVGSLTYGSAKAAISALEIGAAANLSPGSDFEFIDLPTTSYSARNEKVLSGGSSKEVAVVSRDDIAALRKTAVAEIEKQAETELTKKLASGEKLFPESITSSIKSEAFNKEVGEETETLSVDLVLTASIDAYNQQDFDALLDEMIIASIPENLEYNKEDTEIEVEKISEEKDGVRAFTVKIMINLLPKVKVTDLVEKLTGRSVVEATDYLRSQPGISGVEYLVNAPFGFMKNQLPLNPGNIQISIASL